MERKYDKCVRCDTTIDVTNQDGDLCNSCATDKANDKGYIKWLKEERKKEVK